MTSEIFLKGVQPTKFDIAEGIVTINGKYRAAVPPGCEKVSIYEVGDNTVIGFSQRHGGWLELEERTRSGKMMFRCIVCGRKSQTPDKWCPVSGDPVEDVARIITRLAQDVNTGRLDYRQAARQIARTIRPFGERASSGQMLDRARADAVHFMRSQGKPLKSSELTVMAWERQRTNDSDPADLTAVIFSRGLYMIYHGGKRSYAIQNPPDSFYEALALRKMPRQPKKEWQTSE